MHLQVKYGLITLINQERDACQTIEQADLKCPLKKGELSLTKDVDLPREIPPVCAESDASGMSTDANRVTTPSSQMSTRPKATRSPASLPRLRSTGNFLHGPLDVADSSPKA
jgi:hypothetical protein